MYQFTMIAITILLMFPLCQESLSGKRTAVQETRVSRHHGDPNFGHPLKHPVHHRPHYRIEGLKGVYSIGPR